MTTLIQKLQDAERRRAAWAEELRSGRYGQKIYADVIIEKIDAEIAALRARQENEE